MGTLPPLHAGATMEGYRVIIDLGNSLLIVCTNYTGFLITTYIGDCHRCRTVHQEYSSQSDLCQLP